MRLISFSIALGVVGLLLWDLPARGAEEPTPPGWARQAEETFQLGPGVGRELMTQEEWQQHRETMRSLGPEERQRYRQEWHQKMVERARERGITLPKTPQGPGGPRGGGRGLGPGPMR